MASEIPNDTGYVPFVGTSADSFHIHIEDTEVTFLIDSGTRIMGTHAHAKMMPLHIHPHYELFFVEQGTLRVLFQDKEEILEPNDLIIIPPKVEHITMRTNDNSHRYNIKFHIKKNALHVDTSLYHALNAAFAPPYVLLRNYSLFLDTIKNLHGCMLSQNKLYASFYFHKFAVRFLSLAPTLAEQAQKKPIHLETNIMRFHTVSSIINGSFKDNITLEYVAKSLNLSVRQTNRIIQECYGVSFSELILENKMRYAANLLINSNLPIVEISRRSGYSSVKGFYHSFKKKYNCLPSEYRKQHSAKKRVELEDGDEG